MWSYEITFAVAAGLAASLYYIRTMFAGTRYYHLGIFLLHRVAIVTDGDTGIGLETAHELAKRGAHVYLTSKSLESGERARKAVMQRSRSRNVYARELDMRSLKSVRAFVKGFLAEQNHLNILVNNAEVFLSEQATTADGHELHFGVNHLGPFLLTNLLLDTIRATPESTRIINVTSTLHGWADVNRDDLQFSNGLRSYSRLAAYGQSKLANVLFTRHLAGILRDEKTTVNAVNPGFVRSAAMRRFLGNIGYWMCWFFLKTERLGAQTSLCVALDPCFKIESGKYLSDCAVMAESRMSAASRDDDLAAWLWRESERLTKLHEI